MSWTNYQPTTGQWQGQQGTEELEQQQQWMQQQQQVNWMAPAWANVGVNPQTQWPAEGFFPRFTPYVAEVAPLTPYVLTPLGSRAAALGIDNQTRAPLQPVPSPVPEVPPLPGQVPEGFCLGPVSYAQGDEGCCDDHDRVVCGGGGARGYGPGAGEQRGERECDCSAQTFDIS